MDGIELSLLILSPSHTKQKLAELKRKKKRWPMKNKSARGKMKYDQLRMNEETSSDNDSSFGAALNKPSPKRKRGLFSLDTNFIGHVNENFRNSCLILAFAVSYFYNKGNESKENNAFKGNYKSLKEFHSATKPKKRLEKCNLLIKKTYQLIGSSGVSISGPHSNGDLKTLCDYFNAQVHVFKPGLRSRCIFKYPDQFSPERMPIYLLESDGEGQNKHLESITSLSNFFVKKKVCIQCLTFRKDPRYHICKNGIRKTCQHCRKLILQPGDYLNQDIVKNFCMKSVHENFSKECIYCHKTFLNEDCYKGHVKHCEKTWPCEKCNRRVVRGKEHMCYSTLCNLCHKRYVGSEIPNNETDLGIHVCDVTIPSLPKYYPRLAVYDFETRFSRREEEYDLIPNLCIAAFEDGYHESFSTVSFFEEGMNHKLNGKIIPDQLTCQYLPTDYPKKIVQEKISSFYKGRGSEKYGPPDKLHDENNENYPYLIPHKEEFKGNCVYEMLRFFLRGYFQNTTFVAHGASRFDSLPILSMLLRFPEIKIKTIQCGNSVIHIEVVDLNIRFVDSCKFMPDSLAKLAHQFDLEELKTFFPYHFNTKENFGYCGTIPSYEDFWVDITDSKEKKEEKKIFFDRKASENQPWQLENELYDYCMRDIECLVQIGKLYFK